MEKVISAIHPGSRIMDFLIKFDQYSCVSDTLGGPHGEFKTDRVVEFFAKAQGIIFDASLAGWILGHENGLS